MDTNGKGDESQFKLRTKQLLAALYPLLATFISSIVTSISDVYFSLLNSSTTTEKVLSDFKIPNEDALSDIDLSNNNWIICGSSLSGIVIEKLGIRKAMMFSFSVLFIGWLIVSFATNLMWFKVGISICNLSAGLLMPLAPIYIVEISDHVFRSLMLSLIDVTVLIGRLVVQIFVLWLELRTTVYIYAIFTLISILISIASRESPIWLMKNGRTDEALTRWVDLRGSKSIDEYLALESAHRSREDENRHSGRSKISSLIHTFLSRRFLWPLATACTFVSLYRFSGYDLLTYIAIRLIDYSLGVNQIELPFCIGTAVMCVMNVLPCYLMLKFKRRTITMFCGFSAVAGVFLFSIAFYLDLENLVFETVLVILYLVLLTTGLSSLQWIFGELFAGHLRSFGVSLVIAFSFGCNTVDTFLWTILLSRLQWYVICAIYGSLMVFAIGVLYWKQPETKDKTLLEIEEIYDKYSEESVDESIEMMEREIET